MATKAEVLNDLALNRAGQLSARDLGAKYPEGISTVISEVGITRDDLATNTLTAPSAATTSPLTTGTSPTAADYRTATQQIVNPYEEEKVASQLENVFSKQTGIGLPSIGINLPGTGDSLRPGNESGILSIGTPGTGFNELGSGSELGVGWDVGSGFGPATYDLQESIRDQARAAEDEAARTGPSLAEQQQQVRNTFLEALQSQEGQGDGALGTAANVASTGITVADKLGVPIHPLGQVFTLLNTGRNFANQREADKLMNNPNLLGTFLRSVGLGGFLGVDPTVPPGGGNVFHPTPRQSEILSTDPVTRPPKIVDVTTETLPPPPITDMSPERKAQMWNQIQRFQQRPTVTPPEAGDIYDAPSYDPQSASFVDWDE